MTPSFREVPGPAAADHPTVHHDPTLVHDAAAANGAAQAALAGPAANGGARARNTGPAQRGAAAAGNVLVALARNVRMKLTDEEADTGDDPVHHGIDGSDAAGTPWCELGLGVASSAAPMRDGAGDAGPRGAAAAGRAKSARASGDRSAVAVGTTARIEPVRAGAPVRRAEAPRGWTVLGIVGWTLELATVVMLGAALWVLVLALVRAAGEHPGSQRDNGCGRAPESCQK